MAHRVEPQLHRLPPTHAEKTVHEDYAQVPPSAIERRTWLSKLIERGITETSIPGTTNSIERVQSGPVSGLTNLVEIQRQRIRLAGGGVKTDQLLGVTRVQCDAVSGRVKEYRRETAQGQPLRVVQANNIGWRDEVYVYDLAVNDDTGQQVITGNVRQRIVAQFNASNELVWNGTVRQTAGSEVETRQSVNDRFGYAETGLLSDCKRAVTRRTVVSEAAGTRVTEEIMGYDPKLSAFAAPESGHIRVHREALLINDTTHSETTVESVGEEIVVPAEYDKFTKQIIRPVHRYVRYSKKRETSLTTEVNKAGRIIQTHCIEQNYNDSGQETHGLDTTSTFTDTGLPNTVVMKHRTAPGVEVTTTTEYAYNKNRLVELIETDSTGKIRRYRRPPPGTKISADREHPIEVGLMLVE